MPELPEVEIVKRGLAELLPKHRILKVTFDTPKSFPNAEGDVYAFLIGTRIVDVRRRAKVLLIDLGSDYSLVIHLKMTGQLVYVAEQRKKAKPLTRFGAGHPSKSLIGPLPDRSTRVTLELDGAKLFFNDQRKFGWMRLMPTIEIPNIDFMKKVGPEPLEDDFTGADFVERLRRRSRASIKPALLDQTVIAGVGNIYADESLWAARIHPATKVADLSSPKLKVLFAKLQKVLLLSIEKGGSTDRHYVDAVGRKGSYLTFANVFRLQGQPCPRHPGTLIEKIRVAGRGTHICTQCQQI
jgi:formamidopyrimidine-DNA glycosylase